MDSIGDAILSAQAVPIPDSLFYYVLTGVFGSALIAITWRYFNKTEQLLEKLVEGQARHDTAIQLQAQEIKSMRSAIIKSDDIGLDVSRSISHGFDELFSKIETMKELEKLKSVAAAPPVVNYGPPPNPKNPE